MKITKAMFLAAVAGLFLADVALAQTTQPASGVTYNYYQPQSEASPSDLAPMPPTDDSEMAEIVPYTGAACDGGCDGIVCDGACDAVCDGACDSGCDSCGCGGILPCASGDPISLWDRIMGPCRDSALDVGGWVQVGYHTYDTGQFNNYPDTVQLHQAWGYIGKEADGSCGLDWGFRADYVYGTDGPDTQAFGNPPGGNWDQDWDNGNFYGSAIPQAYVELAYGDLSVKAGHFFTICGYEVVPATGNFFYSHAFTMYNAEPFTHSGALATYKANEDVTLYGGWTKGWDTGFDTWGGDTFLGGVTLGLTEDVSLTYTTTVGKIGFGTTASGYSHSIVLDVQLTEKLNYVLLSDYVDYNGALLADPRVGAYVNRYSVVNYLFYEINDCWKAGVRAEWFSNKPDNYDGRNDLYEVTAGLNYKPHANVIIRPEVRWDQDDDGFIVPAAYNNQLGFGMDMILTF
jgi:hypothetical protein